MLLAATSLFPEMTEDWFEGEEVKPPPAPNDWLNGMNVEPYVISKLKDFCLCNGGIKVKRNSNGEAIPEELDKIKDPEDFKQFVDLIRNMVVWDPKKRYTMQQVLDHPFLGKK